MRGRNANYAPLAESVKYAPKLRQTIEQGLSLKRCTKRLSAALSVDERRAVGGVLPHEAVRGRP